MQILLAILVFVPMIQLQALIADNLISSPKTVENLVETAENAKTKRLNKDIASVNEQTLSEIPGEKREESKRYINKYGRHIHDGSADLTTSNTPLKDEYEYEEDSINPALKPLKQLLPKPNVSKSKELTSETQNEIIPNIIPKTNEESLNNLPELFNILNREFQPTLFPKQPKPQMNLPFDSIQMSILPTGPNLPELPQALLPSPQISIKKILFPDILDGEDPQSDLIPLSPFFEKSSIFIKNGIPDSPIFDGPFSELFASLEEEQQQQQQKQKSTTTETPDESEEESSEEIDQTEESKEQKKKCFTIPDIYHGTKKMFKKVSKGNSFKDRIKSVGKTMKKAAKRIGSCTHKVFQDITDFMGLTKRRKREETISENYKPA